MSEIHRITFPIPSLTPIPEDIGPNFSNLTILQTELNSNAMSVPSAISTKGHLVLTQSAFDYRTSDPGVNFAPPPNPGLNPTHQRGASAEEIRERNRQHPLLRQDHANYQTCERCLKTLLLDAVPAIFLEEQRNETLGFGDKTTLVLLTHLWSTYGEIDDDMLAENLERIKSPWSPPTPIETLYRQIKTCMTFATKGGDPITPASAIRTGVSIIENNGLFSLDCKEWRARAPLNRTLANFYQHFRKAEKEFKRNPTTTTGGYHANLATATSHQQQHHHPLPNYASMTPANHDVPFTTTPSAFAAAVQAAAARAAPAATRGLDTLPGGAVGRSYCWSHGYTRNVDHNSMTCRNKKTGHCDASTGTNRMNGKRFLYSPGRNE